MLWTKEAQRQGNCDDNDGGCVDPTVFHPALGTFSVVVMGSAQSVVSIPEGEQKAHKYTCFACSALCTGNYDLYVLVLHLSSSLLKNRRMTKKSRPLTPELSPSKSPGLKMIHAGPDLDGLIILRRPRFLLRGVHLVIYWLIYWQRCHKCCHTLSPCHFHTLKSQEP